MQKSTFLSLLCRVVVLTALVVLATAVPQAGPDQCGSNLSTCETCCANWAQQCRDRGGVPDSYCHWETGYCAGPMCS